jgi:hypothetical protein
MLREIIKGDIIDEVTNFVEEYKNNLMKQSVFDLRKKFADRFEEFINQSMEKPDQLKECI